MDVFAVEGRGLQSLKDDSITSSTQQSHPCKSRVIRSSAIVTSDKNSVAWISMSIGGDVPISGVPHTHAI